jgi:hypothetical protein
MSRSRRGSTTLTVAIFAGAAMIMALTAPRAHREALPERIADSTFWRIVTTFSEPSGVFPSENFVSNETEWQFVIPPNLNRIKSGSNAAYVGVGPEQNFTYISAFKPGIAFICDIRRQNMLLHLMYKALFEMSTDRADFLSKLFARPRPAGLDTASSGATLANAYRAIPYDSLLSDITMSAILSQLVRQHKFALSSEDSATIRAVYGVFVQYGPDVSYSASSRNVRNPMAPSVGGMPLPNIIGSMSGGVSIRTSINGVANLYRITADTAGRQVVERDSAGVWVKDTLAFRNGIAPLSFTRSPGMGIGSVYATFAFLMGLDDGANPGVNRGWLGSESAFRWVKNFQERNLLIPVVGNFAGPKALRAVGEFLREKDAKVSAFYTSNVEQYLFQSRISDDFYENVSTLPTDAGSTFIRSIPNQFNNLIQPRHPSSRLAQTTSSIDSVVASYRRGELISYIALQRLQDR